VTDVIELINGDHLSGIKCFFLIPVPVCVTVSQDVIEIGMFHTSANPLSDEDKKLIPAEVDWLSG